MPILYTVEVDYVIAGFIRWTVTVGSNLTFAEVEECTVPNVDLRGEIAGPDPKTR